MEEKEDNKNKIKILLVDDDAMMRIYFRDIFWIHGLNNKYDIAIVSSLEEADGQISNKDTRPETIFLDVMIPVKGGHNDPATLVKRCLEFIAKIKKDPELSTIKIIIYSGQKEKSLMKAVKELGVDGYLIKGELMPKEIIAFTEKIHGDNK